MEAGFNVLQELRICRIGCFSHIDVGLDVMGKKAVRTEWIIAHIGIALCDRRHVQIQSVHFFDGI